MLFFQYFYAKIFLKNSFIGNSYISVFRLVKRLVVQHKKFQIWNKECLICVILGCKFHAKIKIYKFESKNVILGIFRLKPLWYLESVLQNLPKCENIMQKKTKANFPSDCFCSTGKYFTNKVVKKYLRKEKNRNSL